MYKQFRIVFQKIRYEILRDKILQSTSINDSDMKEMRDCLSVQLTLKHKAARKSIFGPNFKFTSADILLFKTIATNNADLVLNLITCLENNNIKDPDFVNTIMEIINSEDLLDDDSLLSVLRRLPDNDIPDILFGSDAERMPTLSSDRCVKILCSDAWLSTSIQKWNNAYLPQNISDKNRLEILKVKVKAKVSDLLINVVFEYETFEHTDFVNMIINNDATFNSNQYMHVVKHLVHNHKHLISRINEIINTLTSILQREQSLIIESNNYLSHLKESFDANNEIIIVQFIRELNGI